MALWTESTLDPKNERPEADSLRDTYTQRQKESASQPDHESVVGSGVTVEGKIEGAGNVRIAGQFKGEIDVKGDLRIERGAHVTGKINVQTVTIEGELDGNLVATGQVTLSESGQVVGELKARTLTVAAGSRMRGNVEFGWDTVEGQKPGKVGANKVRTNGEALSAV